MYREISCVVEIRILQTTLTLIQTFNRKFHQEKEKVVLTINCCTCLTPSSCYSLNNKTGHVTRCMCKTKTYAIVTLHQLQAIKRENQDIRMEMRRNFAVVHFLQILLTRERQRRIKPLVTQPPICIPVKRFWYFAREPCSRFLSSWRWWFDREFSLFCLGFRLRIFEGEFISLAALFLTRHDGGLFHSQSPSK